MTDHTGKAESKKQRSEEEVEADMQELEKFLLDIDCLDNLDRWANRLNIFDVLSITGNEIRHSNFLAWLLDPNETHGLGEYFLKKILQNIIKGHPGKKPISLFDLDRMDLDDAYVLREDHNIDIQIVSEESKLVLTIENKVYSDEHDDQLNRYYEITEKKYPEYKKIYAYLTPYGDLPSDVWHWASLSYEYIYSVIRSILNNRELSNRCRIYLEDYSNILGDVLMNDMDLRKVCSDIYSKHHKALDILMNNLPTRQNVLYEKIWELLEPYFKENKLISVKSTYSEIRFTTEKIRNKIGLYGDNTWVDSGDLLAFYAPNYDGDNRYLVMTLGPGDQKCRQAWFDYLKGTDLFACNNKNLPLKYKDVATHRIREKNLEDNEFIERYLDSLKKYLDNIEEVERIILAGPDVKPE